MKWSLYFFFLSLPFFGETLQAMSSKKASPPEDRKASKKNEKLPEHVPSQLLVRFVEDLGPEKRKEIFKRHSAQELEKIGSSPLYLIQLQKDADLVKSKKALMAEKAIKYAEPNLRMRVMQQPELTLPKKPQK